MTTAQQLRMHVALEVLREAGIDANLVVRAPLAATLVQEYDAGRVALVDFVKCCRNIAILNGQRDFTPVEQCRDRIISAKVLADDS